MNEKIDNLNGFIPDQDPGVRIELRKELFPVIERISRIIPPKLVWELFSSKPGQIKRRIVFPRLRVDTVILSTDDGISLSKFYEKKEKWEKSAEWYKWSSQQVFKALLWVEVGFQGLENLANSPASKNWTSGIGNFVNAQERAEGIMFKGKLMFNDCLRNFIEFRDQREIDNDIFTQYKVEYLLDPYRQQN
ncbi:MAG: hypothetical protein ABIJ43_02445 [Candidatus Beckwithbacteria bacterium]|nr:hypothetical protein [Patescibacteria group bacterium]